MIDLLPLFENSVIGGAIFGTVAYMLRERKLERQEEREFYNDEIRRLERRVDELERQYIRVSTEANASKDRGDKHSAAIKKRPTYSTVRQIAAEIKAQEEK